MRIYCPKKDGELWVRLMGRTKPEAQRKLVKNFTWWNCFDMEFKPTKEELEGFEIVEVEIVEKQS